MFYSVFSTQKCDTFQMGCYIINATAVITDRLPQETTMSMSILFYLNNSLSTDIVNIAQMTYYTRFK